jgi:hypothetical protein
MLTAKAVRDFLHRVYELAEMGVDMDPIMERSFTFKIRVDELVAPYWEM